jgi:hypothetical protein
VHSDVKGVAASTLPADGSFDFNATLYETVNSGCSGTLDTLADPNPATFTLPFTTK